ncbi:MAG: hypothetical protein ACRD3J_26760 [Thermoanaerobaculia bacterium]
MIRPRGWLIVTTIGCALVCLAMLTIALTMLDKTHFGWMIGTYFLEIISSGMMVGSLILLIGVFGLPERWSWRGITLIVWGFIGFTSPAFGWLFLFPWLLLALSLPLVVTILIRFFRVRRENA